MLSFLNFKKNLTLPHNKTTKTYGDTLKPGFLYTHSHGNDEYWSLVVLLKINTNLHLISLIMLILLYEFIIF